MQMKESDEGRAEIDMLSPMEKYDIFIGDYDYKLAKKYLDGKGNGPTRESWEGYCHAWAPAASHYAEPAPKSVTNADGIPIDFGSGDVKALLVANYHEQMFPDGSALFRKLKQKGSGPKIVYGRKLSSDAQFRLRSYIQHSKFVTVWPRWRITQIQTGSWIRILKLMSENIRIT